MIKCVYEKCLYMEKKSKGTFKEAALIVFIWKNPWQQTKLYLCVIYPWFILGVLMLRDLDKNKPLNVGNDKKFWKTSSWFNIMFLWSIQEDLPSKLLHYFWKTWKTLVVL